jgi:hypothetical protein
MNNSQSLPGSLLLNTAQQMGWQLPDTSLGFSFLSYVSLPLPTKHLTAAKVLRFRDCAWYAYFNHQPFLHLIQKKFGLSERKNVKKMSLIKQRHKILEE